MKKFLLFIFATLFALAGRAATVTDELTVASFGASGSTVANYTCTGATGITYALGCSVDDYENIHFASTSGLWTYGESPGKVTSITFTWDVEHYSSSTYMSVYGKNEPYAEETYNANMHNSKDLLGSSATDETKGTLLGTAYLNDGTATITVDGDYAYIGFTVPTGTFAAASISIEWEVADEEPAGTTMVVSPYDGEIVSELSEIIVSCEDGIEWDVNNDFYFQVLDDSEEVVAGVWDAKLKEESGETILSYSLPLYDDNASGNVSITLTEPGNYHFTIPAGAFYLGDSKTLSEETTITFTIGEVSEPEPDYTLSYAPASGEELGHLDTVVISCEGGIALAETGELEWDILSDNAETGYTLYCSPTFEECVGEGGNYTSLTFVVKYDSEDSKLVAAGTYTIAGTLTLTNDEMVDVSLTYIIDGTEADAEPTEATLTYEPDMDSDQTSLSTVTITSDIAFVFGEATTLSYDITDYGEDTAYTLVATVDAGETYTITFTVMKDGSAATITKEGNYGVDIPSGTFTYANGTTQGSDIIIEYYVNGSEYVSEGIAITISPSGETEAFDTITISTPDGRTDMDWNWDDDVPSKITVTNNATGDTVAYGVSESDNYDYTTCTEVYITLNTEVSEPGEYTITVPANSLYFNDDEEYSAEGTTVVTIPEAEPDYTLYFDPADGAQLEKLDKLVITCEGGIDKSLSELTLSVTDSNGKSYDSFDWLAGYDESTTDNEGNYTSLTILMWDSGANEVTITDDGTYTVTNTSAFTLANGETIAVGDIVLTYYIGNGETATPVEVGSIIYDDNGVAYEVTDASANTVSVYRQGDDDVNGVTTGEVDVPETFTYTNGVTYTVTGIVYEAFYKSDVTAITLPGTITTWSDSVDGHNATSGYAIYDCEKLEMVTFGEGITSIPGSCVVFDSGTATVLTTINLPSTLSTIGNKAFNRVTALSDIYCEALTAPTITNNNMFNGMGSAQEVTVHVHCDAIDSYKSTSGWALTASPVMTIEGTDCPDVDYILTFDPEDGKTVDQLDYITITCEGGIVLGASDEIAFSVYNETTDTGDIYDWYYAWDSEKNGTKDDAGNYTSITLTLEDGVDYTQQTITEPGTYTITNTTTITLANGDVIGIGEITLTYIIEEAKDYSYYFVPTEGVVESIGRSDITLYFNSVVAHRVTTSLPSEITMTNDEGETVATVQGIDGNGTSHHHYALTADITDPGTYTLTIPEGFYYFDDDETDLNEEITGQWIIETSEPVSYTLTFTPEEGTQSSLSSVTISCEGGIAKFGNSDYEMDDIYIINSDGDQVAQLYWNQHFDQYAYTTDAAGNYTSITALVVDPEDLSTLTLVAEDTYTINFSEGYFTFADESVSEGTKLTYYIDGTEDVDEGEKDYTLYYDPEDGATGLEEISTIKISCEGGITSNVVDLTITSEDGDDEELGYFEWGKMWGDEYEQDAHGNIISITVPYLVDEQAATLTAEGTYHISGSITLANGETETISLTYTIGDGATADPYTLTFDPADGKTVESLETLTISCEGGIVLQDDDEIVLNIYNNDGSSTGYFYDWYYGDNNTDGTINGDGNYTDIILYVEDSGYSHHTITEPGTYVVKLSTDTPITLANGEQVTEIELTYIIEGTPSTPEPVTYTIDPAEGVVESGELSTITITFSEEIDGMWAAEDLDDTNCYVTDEQGTHVAYASNSWDYDENTLTIPLTETITAAGTYTFHLDADAFSFTSGATNEAIEVEYTIEEAVVSYELTFTPEPGILEDGELSEILIHCAGGISTYQALTAISAYASPITKDGVTVAYLSRVSRATSEEDVKDEADNYTTIKIGICSTNNSSISITDPGTYTVTLTEGVFTFADSSTNQKTEIEYIIPGDEETVDYTITFDPENGASPETLSKVVLSCEEGMAIAESDEFEWAIYLDGVAYTDEDENAYVLYGCPMFTDYEGDADEGILTSLTFNVTCNGVHTPLTEAGTYTIEIPADAITFADGETTYEGTTLTYYLQGGEVTAPTLVSVDPELDSTIETTDNVFTLTFSGNVKISDDESETFIIPAEKGGDYTAFESIVSQSGDEYDTVWILTVPADLLAEWPSSEAPFEMEVTAIDEDGNSEMYELDYTVNVVIDRGDKPTVTTVPVDGATVSVFDALEVYCDEGISMNWYDYSDDDDPVSISLDDIYVYGPDGALIMDSMVTDYEYIDEADYDKDYAALGVRLTFAQRLKEPGTYKVMIPAYMFILGDETGSISSDFYSDEIEVTVEVDGTEYGQLDYTLDPVDGHIVSDLTEITITYDGLATLGTGTITVSNGTTTINATATITSSSSSQTVITITLDSAITEEGEWTLTIPQGMFIFDDVASNAVEATFNVVPGALAAGDVIVYEKVAYIVNEDLETVTVALQSSYQGVTGVDTTGEITIPEWFVYQGVTYTVTECAASAFSGQTALTSVDIEAAITEWNGGSTFYNCTGITSVTLGEDCANLAASMFYSCSALEEISLPEGETSVPSGCFNYCSSMKTIYLPSTMTSLVANSLGHCTSLVDIYCYAMEPPTTVYSGGSTFNGCRTGQMILHVYCDAKSAYEESEYWGQFTVNGATDYIHEIVAIDDCPDETEGVAITIAPEGETDAFDTITITAADGRDDMEWNDDVDYKDVVVVSNTTGDTVAYGTDVEDNFSYDTEECTEIYITLSATVSAAGEYTITVPEKAIYFANDGTPAYSAETTSVVTVVETEEPIDLGYTFNPEPGETDDLTTIILTFDAEVTVGALTAETCYIADASGEPVATLESYELSADGMTLTITMSTTPTDAGTYTFVLAEGTLTYGASQTNDEITANYVIADSSFESGVPEGFYVVPADGSILDIIDVFQVYNEDGKIYRNINNDETPVYNEQGEKVATVSWAAADDFSGDYVKGTLSTAVTEAGTYTIEVPAGKLTTSTTSSSAELDAFTITYIITGNSEGEGQIEWTEVVLEETYDIEETNTTGYYHYTATEAGKFILHYQSLNAPNFYSDDTLLDELTYSQTETVEGYTGLYVDVQAGDDIYVVISSTAWDTGSLYFTFEEYIDHSDISLNLVLPASDTVEMDTMPYDYQIVVTVDGYDAEGYMTFDITDDSGEEYLTGYFAYSAADEDALEIGLTDAYYYWVSDSEEDDIEYDTFLTGSTYTLTVSLRESQSSWSEQLAEEALLTIVGTGSEYEYSDIEFVSISPSTDTELTELADTEFTLTFSGAVTITDDSYINFGVDDHEEFASIVSQSGGDYDTTWILTISADVLELLTGDYEGETLTFLVGAEDERGRRVHSNESQYELKGKTLLHFEYDTDIVGEGTASHTITTTPASGATVGHIDTITFACEDNIDLNNDPAADTIIVYDEDGDPVAYGAEWSDNGEYNESSSGWTYPTEIYLTLDKTIVAEGSYSIIVPESTFVLGDSGYESKGITIVVNVDGSEDVPVTYTMVVDPADGDELTEISEIIVSCEGGMEWNVDGDFYFQVFDDSEGVVAGVWDAKVKEQSGETILSYSLPLYDDDAAGNVSITLTEPGNYHFTIPAGAFFLGDSKTLSEETTINFTITESAGGADDGFTVIVLDEEYSLEGAMSDKFYYKWTAEEDGTLTLTKSSGSVTVTVYTDADMTESVSVTNTTSYPQTTYFEVEEGQTYYIVLGFSLITSGTFTATFEPVGEGSGVTLTRVLPEADAVEWTTIPYDYEVVVTADGYDEAGYMTFQIVDDDSSEVIYSGYFTYTDSDEYNLGIEEPYYYWKSNSEDEGAYSSLYEGHTYSFEVRLRENQQTTTSLAEETLFTITGAAEEYVYSDYNFVSISPAEDETLTTLADTDFTLTFDGPVTIVEDASFVNFGNNGGQYPFKAITSTTGDDYATEWIVTIDVEQLEMLTGDYSGMDLNFVVAAEDEQGRRVHSNNESYDNEGNTYLTFTYETSFSGAAATYTVTTDPADGDTVGHIDTITYACDDIIYNYEEPETVIVYDNEGNAVAYGVEWSDNGVYEDNNWVDATEVYLTLTTTIVAAGNYTISAPAGTFVLGENGVSSDLIEIHVTVDGSEEVQADYTLTYEPADGDEVDLLDYLTIYCEGGIVLGSSMFDEIILEVYNEDGTETGYGYDWWGINDSENGTQDANGNYTSITLTLQDFATGNAATITEPGTYIVKLSSGTPITLANGETVTEIELTFTVKDSSTPSIETPLTTDPASGDSVESLPYIDVWNPDGVLEMDWDDSPYDETYIIVYKDNEKVGACYDYGFDELYDETTDVHYGYRIYFKDDATGTSKYEFIEAGEYKVSFPGEFFMTATENGVNTYVDAFDVTFTVTGKEITKDYTLVFDPEDNAELDQLDYMTISCEGGIVLDSLSGSNEVTFKVCDEDGEETGFIYDWYYSSDHETMGTEDADGHFTSITLTLCDQNEFVADVITEPGTYLIKQAADQPITLANGTVVTGLSLTYIVKEKTVEPEPEPVIGAGSIVHDEQGVAYVIQDDEESVYIAKQSPADYDGDYEGQTEGDLVIGETIVAVENDETYNVTGSKASAFMNATITSITLPGTLATIGTSAFYGCVNLASVTLNEGIEYIGDNMFYGCTSLTEINVPEGVTSIGSWAFYNCTKLATVYLPSTIDTGEYDSEPIGGSAFRSCTSLTEMTILAETPPYVANNAFKDTPVGSATLYVPCASVEDYMNYNGDYDGWEKFGTIIGLNCTEEPTDYTLTFTPSDDDPVGSLGAVVVSSEAGLDADEAESLTWTITKDGNDSGYSLSFGSGVDNGDGTYSSITLVVTDASGNEATITEAGEYTVTIAVGDITYADGTTNSEEITLTYTVTGDEWRDTDTYDALCADLSDLLAELEAAYEYAQGLETAETVTGLYNTIKSEIESLQAALDADYNAGKTLDADSYEEQIAAIEAEISHLKDVAYSEYIYYEYAGQISEIWGAIGNYVDWALAEMGDDVYNEFVDELDALDSEVNSWRNSIMSAAANGELTDADEATLEEALSKYNKLWDNLEGRILSYEYYLETLETINGLGESLDDVWATIAKEYPDAVDALSNDYAAIAGDIVGLGNDIDEVYNDGELNDYVDAVTEQEQLIADAIAALLEAAQNYEAYYQMKDAADTADDNLNDAWDIINSYDDTTIATTLTPDYEDICNDLADLQEEIEGYYTDGTAAEHQTEIEAAVADIEARIQKLLADAEEMYATGIYTVGADYSNDEVYTLGGQKVNAPNARGIYVINGKKVFVR